jgi:hypothetical protein
VVKIIMRNSFFDNKAIIPSSLNSLFLGEGASKAADIEYL